MRVFCVATSLYRVDFHDHIYSTSLLFGRDSHRIAVIDFWLTAGKRRVAA
jgi:hypothetical protein